MQRSDETLRDLGKQHTCQIDLRDVLANRIVSTPVMHSYKTQFPGVFSAPFVVGASGMIL